MLAEKTFWVYILRCENGSLYTGYTDNLEKRFQAHVNGKGGKYTRAFRPVSIAKPWEIKEGKSRAMQLEAYLKKLSRREKEEIIKNNLLVIK